MSEQRNHKHSTTSTSPVSLIPQTPSQQIILYSPKILSDMQHKDIYHLDDLVDLDSKFQQYLSNINNQNLNQITEFIFSKNFLKNKFKRRCFTEGILIFSNLRSFSNNFHSLYAELVCRVLSSIKEAQKIDDTHPTEDAMDFIISEMMKSTSPLLIRHFLLKAKNYNIEIKKEFWSKTQQFISIVVSDMDDFKSFVPKSKNSVKYSTETLNCGYEENSIQYFILKDNEEKLKTVLNGKNFKIPIKKHSIYSEKKKEIFPLYFAAECGSLKCFQYIISFSKFQDLTQQYPNLCQYAVTGGNLEILEISEKRVKIHNLIIKKAVKQHRYEIFNKYKEKYRKQEEMKKEEKAKNQEKEESEYKDSCLHYAALKYNINAVRSYYNEKPNSLIEPDPERDEQSKSSWTKPIHVACQAHALSIVKFIIDHKLEERDGAGSNNSPALCWSAGWKDIFITEFLIFKGANVNNTSAKLRHPMHSCCSKGDLAIAKLLFEHGAKIDPIDHKGSSPLLESSQYDYFDLFVFLLLRGANVNAKRQDGYTPLHLAAQNLLHEVCALYIAFGADCNAKNNSGELPIDLPQQYHKGEQSILTMRVLGYYGESNYDKVLIKKGYGWILNHIHPLKIQKPNFFGYLYTAKTHK